MPTRVHTAPPAPLAAAVVAPVALGQSFTTFPRGPIRGISEDGRYAACSSGNTAYRVDASTGESLRLGPGRVRDMTPDGTAIVGLTSAFRGGFLWTRDGGYVSLTDTVPAFSDGNTRAYAISDDGQSIGAPFYGEPSFIYGSLTIDDVLTYQNAFDAADPTADLDGDGEPTILDLLALQTAFDTGCA